MNRLTSCPTCGQAVEIVTSDEGTSHYVGIDAWDANTLRVERTAAILAATMNLRGALRRIACEDVPGRGDYTDCVAAFARDALALVEGEPAS